MRVAAGEKLPFLQGDIRGEGHAIQARVTAERADKSFRPDVGKIELWSPPSGIRIDTGVTTGTMVGLHYDSLLAKVIASGADRAQALARLRSGLDDLTVLGPATNRAFLRDTIGTPDFAQGRATTRLIDDNWPDGSSDQRRYSSGSPSGGRGRMDQAASNGRTGLAMGEPVGLSHARQIRARRRNAFLGDLPNRRQPR